MAYQELGWALPHKVGVGGCECGIVCLLLCWLLLHRCGRQDSRRRVNVRRRHDAAAIAFVRPRLTLYAVHLVAFLPQNTGGGWFRPSGLFAVLLSALPGLKEALVEPMRPEVAVAEPAMALSCLSLLEAGVRWV